MQNGEFLRRGQSFESDSSKPLYSEQLEGTNCFGTLGHRCAVAGALVAYCNRTAAYKIMCTYSSEQVKARLLEHNGYVFVKGKDLCKFIYFNGGQPRS